VLGRNPDVLWRKSSRSGGAENCVELAYGLGAVRDSKNPDGPALSVELASMLLAIKAGQFDL
jgi:hypothetical protein